MQLPVLSLHKQPLYRPYNKLRTTLIRELKRFVHSSTLGGKPSNSINGIENFLVALCNLAIFYSLLNMVTVLSFYITSESTRISISFLTSFGSFSILFFVWPNISSLCTGFSSTSSWTDLVRSQPVVKPLRRCITIPAAGFR